jgi:branched-subunit amino acid ABC-type transport system permease component
VIAQLLLNGLIAGAICALIAIGFTITHLSRRFFDFSIAGSMVLAAYLSFRLADATGSNPAVLIFNTIAITGVLNCVLQLFAYRPLRSVGSRSTVMLVASLGLMVVLVNVVSLAFGDAPYRPLSPGLPESFQVLGGRLTSINMLTFGVSLVLGLLTCYGFARSSFGAQLRAVANDKILSKAVGLNLARIELVGGWVGLALATCGVILSGLDFGLTPSLGFQMLIPAVTASIMGGVGSIKGAFLAGFLVGLLQQASAALLGVAWQDAILFSILIVIFLVKPRGFWGTSFVQTQA